MKKRITTIVLAALATSIVGLTAHAETLSIDGMIVDIPSTWVETSRDISDESSQISYTSGDSAISIATTPYDESIADMSYILIDAYLYGIKDMDGFTQFEQQNNTISGKTAHTTFFSCQGNAGILVSLDTGVSIANFLFICPASSTDASSDEFINTVTSVKFTDSVTNNDSEEKEYTKYESNIYKVGTDIPVGEYIVFAENGRGYFCVSSDSNQDDILFNDNFDYNSIITANDGEYLELSHCYAIPIEENPEIDLAGTGTFKVGLHILAGEYKLEATDDHGYYCIYPDSRQQDIVSNDIFEGQNYVTVSDGQYLVLDGCKFTEVPQKPVKTYTDSDTVKKVQEALNTAGYDCGTPDGVAGSGTKAAIEKYQTDKSLTVTGSITDELLESLGI